MDFFPALLYVRNVMSIFDNLLSGFFGTTAAAHAEVKGQNLRRLSDIMPICSCYDHRERDPQSRPIGYVACFLFSPVSRVATYGFQSKGSFFHRSIYTLSSPGNAFHVIISRKTTAPKGTKEADTLPSGKVGIYGAWSAELFLRQLLPLAASAKHIHYGFKDISG
jgi:hypothetical protein